MCGESAVIGVFDGAAYWSYRIGRNNRFIFETISKMIYQEQSGWVLNRVKGSHHIMAKEGKAVPVHGTKDLMPGLISGLEKQTGVKLR